LIHFVKIINLLIFKLVSHIFYTSFVWINNYIYNQAVQSDQIGEHFKIFLIIHILAWILQFIGHGFFESFPQMFCFFSNFF